MPPAILIIGIGREHGKGGFLLPLPLFLLWPFAVLAGLGLIALYPFAGRGENRGDLWRTARVILEAFGSLSGLLVNVETGERKIYVRFI